MNNEKIDVKKVLLDDIRKYFKHELIYNPTLIKQRYGFVSADGIIDLVNRLTFKI